MKILFICSSLEINKDGVGDYTRCLAIELIKQGYNVALLAINDKNIDETISENQYNDNISLLTLRFPAVLNYEQKKKMAKEYIEKFDPDWLSLQYVPYGFQDKGLPIGLVNFLKQIGGDDRKWHVMFHELWLSISKISPLKHKIISFFQKKIVVGLLKDLNAKCIMTSNRLYQLVLHKEDIISQILPLFSSISKSIFDTAFIEHEVIEKLPEPNKSLDNYKFLGIFGTIYPDSNIETVLRNLITKTDKQLILLIFGKSGAWGINEIKRLELILKDKILFLNLGMLHADKISTLLQFIDTGISCTSTNYIGKSSVFAAMRFHNLNIILPPKNIFPEYDKEIEEYKNLLISRPAEQWDVNFIAKQFIANLN